MKMQTRREFIAAVSVLGAAGLAGGLTASADETPLETTTVRLANIGGICLAPQYASEELLRLEGFTDIRFVETVSGVPNATKVARGEIDFSMNFAAPLVIAIDSGVPIVLLAGVHPGCFELFAREGISKVSDLKGASVGVQALGSSQHVFFVSIATYVGLDPVKDINWVASSPVSPKELFAEGKIDAFLGFPPDPQELRARNIGHVIVNSAVDRPWSKYFCCLLSGNSEFVQRNPVATKRVLRAILKTADLCATQPKRMAQRLIDDKFTGRYDYALQALQDVPYGKWREYDPEDTIRFYALRLREAAMITSNPADLIAAAADWRFLDELRRELKS
jgi:NitT/TauT family transport system substrate-binding protein